MNNTNLRAIEDEKLFDRIQIYQRDKACVYDSEIDTLSAAKILQECLFGKWNTFEKGMLTLGQERLKGLRSINKT